MRKYVVLLALTTLATANIMDSFADLKKIDADDFGRSIIDSLQVHMETGDPVERFTEIMHSVEEMIQNDQRDADQKNRDEQERCDRDIEEIQKDNSMLLRRLVEIQATLDELNPQLVQKQGVLKGKLAWREQLQVQINEKQAARDAEAAVFKQKMEEHDYAEFVIQTVKHMFSENGSSFLEVKDNKAIVDHLLKAADDASKFKLRTSYAHMFKLLSQIAMNMERNEATVQRILDLSNMLLHNIEQSRKIENKAEQVRTNNFNNEMTLLNRDMTKLNTQIDQLNAEIIQIQDRITNATRDQTDTKNRQNIKQKQVDDRGAECHEAAYAYQQARAKRDQNRRIVSDIIGIFHANQRDFKAYIKTRHEAGDYDGQDFKILKPGQ